MALYIQNTRLLDLIHQSKLTYCEITDETATEYDVALARMSFGQLVQWSERNGEAGMVIRMETDAHIPKLKKPRPRTNNGNKWIADHPFDPFAHYRLDENLYPIEVVRSFWSGDFETGEYSIDRGHITDELGEALMLVVRKIAQKFNWRDYSYRDEMEEAAITHLCAVALKFNEAKSTNPLSYYTTTVERCFTKVLNGEKTLQTFRDDILVETGVEPSVNRQFGLALSSAGSIEPTKLKGKRGRRRNNWNYENPQKFTAPNNASQRFPQLVEDGKSFSEIADLFRIEEHEVEGIHYDAVFENSLPLFELVAHLNRTPTSQSTG